MHRIFLLSVLSFFLSVSLFAQVVPNSSFENWTNGNPDGWTAVTNVQPFFVNITKSSTAHTGSASLRGDVSTYLTQLVTPLVVSGTPQDGFAISQRYASLTGFYQFTPVSGDQLSINCELYAGTNPIASAVSLLNAASAWTQFNVNFIYVTNDVPTKALIQIIIFNTTTYHQGSFFLVDDIDLSGTATSINDKNDVPTTYTLEQNYPNPFNPSTTIKYDLADNVYVSLKIYNAIGGEVASLINSVVPAGSHELVFDASALKSGVYFYTLTAGSFVQTRKMILMK